MNALADDDGLPTMAGVVPTDASHLASFLEEYDDASAFELTYIDAEGGPEHTRLLRDVSIRQRSLDRPAAAPAIECVPLTATADPFTIRVDAIEMLSVVDLSLVASQADPDTLAEQASLLRLLAGLNPDVVEVSHVLTLLDREGEETVPRQDALQALRRIAETRPQACTPAIPILRSLLTDDALTSPAPALASLRAIGDTDPAAIAPLADHIRPYLHASDDASQREATRCIAAIADADPADAVDAVPGLAAVLADEGAGQSHAVYALSCLSREYPEALKPVTEELRAVITDDARSDSERLNATAALGRLVGEHPSEGVELVAALVELLDADHHKLRNNAIALIGDVAKIHTDVVAPHVDAITPLLTVEDTYTRINTSAAVSRVAEDFPDEVEQVAPTLRELLDDEHPIVRENACWGLGYLQDATATEKLETLSRTDDDDDVRTRAQWALTQMETDQGL